MLTCKSTRCRGRKDKAQLNLNFDERFRSALHFINRRPWEILAALQIRKERSRGESITQTGLWNYEHQNQILSQKVMLQGWQNLQKPSNCFAKLHLPKSFFVHCSFYPQKILSQAPRTANLTCPTTTDLKNWKGKKILFVWSEWKGTKIYKSVLKQLINQRKNM